MLRISPYMQARGRHTYVYTHTENIKRGRREIAIGKQSESEWAIERKKCDLKENSAEKCKC